MHEVRRVVHFIWGIIEIQSRNVQSFVLYLFCHSLCFHLFSLDFRAFQYSQALIFAVEEINNSSSLLPGVSLGYKIYDTCSSMARGVKVAMELINGNEKSEANGTCIKPAQVQAIIGDTASSPCMAIAKSIGPFNIPIVSIYVIYIYMLG